MKRIIILLLFVSQVIFAQKITILNLNTNEPINGVTATNIINSKHAVSNIDGILDLSIFNDKEIIYFQHLSFYEYESLKKNITIHKTLSIEPKSNELNEVFLSASKKEVKRSRIAQEISILLAKDIIKSAPQTSADMLAKIPGIKVQKSQFGGGSPVLRGMEANRILLVVDGVRMNNAIYRKGHLQNSISVSPNLLERTEIIFGPSSVIYGSDALGGVIHYYTKKPKTNETLKIIPTFLTRYSTVNNELTANASVEIQSKKIASFTSISRSKFEDLKIGRNRSHGFKTWGLQTEYSNNTDTYYNENSIVNTNPYILKNVGFDQLDILQKIVIPLSNTTDLNFNLQYSKSSKINRFDQLMRRKNGNLRFAEWYYGPQKRFLASSQIEINPKRKWLDNGTITLAYQNIKESRIQREFNSLKRYSRFENVDVFSVNGDFEVPISSKNKRVFSYGTEFAYNKVNSSSKGEKLEVNGNSIIGITEKFIVQTRYPDNGSSYTSSAFYADYRQDISNKETLNTGMRITNTALNASWKEDVFISLPNHNISLNNTAATITIGYVLKPKKSWQFNAVVSSGFRSPNIDDIGKIREKNDFVTVPNIHLKPEHAYNGEISIIKYINNKKANLSFTTYYTLLNRYITRDLFKLDGHTTINFDGNTYTTIANVNKGKAQIFGGTVSFNGKISKYFYGKASTTFTKGAALDSDMPLSSIPPIFGLVEFGYAQKKWDTSLTLKYNGKKNFSDYNIIEGIDNIEQTPYNTQTNDYNFGTPAWQTLNFSSTYKLNKKINIIFNIDNIFDAHYIEFASSISSPGRNFSFSVMSSF